MRGRGGGGGGVRAGVTGCALGLVLVAALFVGYLSAFPAFVSFAQFLIYSLLFSCPGPGSIT